MVGRRNTLLVTKRSLRNSDISAGKRPRRAVQNKLLDDTVGLSRREEQELNKALYASLHETRRTKSVPSLCGHSSSSGNTGNSTSPSTRASHSSSTSNITRASNLKSLGQRRSLRTSSISPKRLVKKNPSVTKLKKSGSFTHSSSTHSHTLARSIPAASISIDESSQDSVRSSCSSVNGSKRKIHAQRKFAQGCSLPGTPSCTPIKSSTPPVKIISSRIPKTEDFLTFLCLRGSSILPPHLDIFNYSREEMPSQEEGPRSAVSSAKIKCRRESTPDSSSTSSGANEEVAEAAAVSTPSSTGRSSGSSLLAKRSAARASAGTPETARGIVSLRQGLQRKVSTSSSSSSSARFPVSSSPSRLVSGLTNTPQSWYRTKFYFTPEKSPSPSKASGIRPGEFTPPSLFSSARPESSYFGSTHNFSPLVCPPSSSKFTSNASPSGSLVSRASSSSSSSSLSSSYAGGASKRKRRRSLPSSDATSQRSSLGAFSPVRGPKHSPVRSGRSGSSVKVRSSRKDSQTRGNANEVKSARKSLLGKLTSVARQQARKILFRSAKRSVSDVRQTKGKATKSETGSNSPKIERRGRKRKVVTDEKQNSSKKVGKKLKSRVKEQSRISARLRGMPRLARVSRSRLQSDDTDEIDGGRFSDKKDEIHGATGSGDSRMAKKKKQEKKVQVQSGESGKTRRPYKIRPLERVRTRGYSLLIASKQVLKRAKRDNTAVKSLAKSNMSKVNGSDVNSKPKRNLMSKHGKKVETGMKTRKPSERRSLVHYESWEDDGSVDNDESTDKDPSFTTPEKKRKSEQSSSGSGDVAMVTRHSKDTKERQGATPKKYLAKKAKTTPASPSVSSPEALHEENSIPVFHPTEAEFSDPVTYINKIQSLAEPYGMCKIIPPASWKLDSNKISGDIRFTSQVQHIHRLYQRWGPNVQHSAAINQHLLSELSNVTTTPQIGGVEIDLPQLYRLVEEAGGPTKMTIKKHWARVADIMNVPKQAMDRTMRLYDIYCRHVFPYATLSQEEKEQLEEEVKAIHELQTVEDDAITRGKSMSVAWFNRIARYVKSMWFKEEPSPAQVENEYWKIIEERKKHVAVQCGHINTHAQASAFPTRKDSAYSRHSWNLNNIPENDQCVLKYLGPISGITIPTLHVGMLFSTSCWSTDPHCLPYIQYLHTGADIIWYCIPKSQRSKFRSAMTEISSSLITHKPRWLKEDCVMVNPRLLKEKGVKVGRCLHSGRQFVVVFPGAYTATVTCGYSVSESVHFATSKWMPLGMDASLALTKSGEKELFSMCQLLCGLAQDEKVDAATLVEALPLLSSLIYKELDLRTQLHAAGLRSEKRAVFTESPTPVPGSSRKQSVVSEEEKVCEVCDRICYLSMVLNEQDEQVLCLEHGLKHVQRKKNLKWTRLFLRYNQSELEVMLKGAKDRLTQLTLKVETSSTSNGSKSRPNVKQAT